MYFLRRNFELVQAFGKTASPVTKSNTAQLGISLNVVQLRVLRSAVPKVSTLPTRMHAIDTGIRLPDVLW